ncbi:MAG: AAA family ATPase [Holosporales bacterium]|jgi:wobble nucleotide-excising tRNase|nr:AAA family ATPase [Holosporales bacterium]
MIKKIKLTGIANFGNFEQKESVKEGCNIVFGFNGSGKTTLSRMISFFGSISFISEEEKKAIFEDIKEGDSSEIEITLNDGNKIKYPAAKEHDKPICVFNSNFVAAHVFDGTKAYLKKFGNVNEKMAITGINNKEIQDINVKIDNLINKKKKLETKKSELENTLKDIKTHWSQEFNKAISGSRMLKIDIPEEPPEDKLEIERLTSDYNLSLKQDALSNDINQLSSLIFEKSNIDFAELNELLGKNIKQVSKDILEKRIREIKELFSDEAYKNSVVKWFRFGRNILEQSKGKPHARCPICDSDISNKLDALIGDFNGYFDKSYEDFIRQLNNYIEIIQNAIKSVELNEQNKGNLEKLYERYKNELKGIQIENFDFENIKAPFQEIKRIVENKMNNIQSMNSVEQKIIDAAGKYNTSMDNFKKVSDDVSNVLKSKKLDAKEILKKIQKAYKDAVILEFDQSNGGKSCESYKMTQDNLSTINTKDELNQEGLLYWQNKLREELAKIKAESKGINEFLKRMGIDHFTIDINEDRTDENIIVKYTNSKEEKNKLNNMLSDGEKTALAFAYFLSKFKNERSTDGKINESVVVLDDPISSLDENRLYSTALLIESEFKNVSQLIVLSHSFLFLKFFNSLKKNNNCLFLHGNALSELPDELKNFETPYFYMLKELIEFKEKKREYEKVRKYLPNHCRRVLETFLSFEFATFNAKAGRNPGLGEFSKDEDWMKDFDENTKNDLKDKINKIKIVTDPHSHGNLQTTEQSYYVPEDDLKTMVELTISIIETINKSHLSSVKNMQKDKLK